MRRRGLWQRIKTAIGLERPDEDTALVPAGPPRRPLGVGGVALELPREPEDVDARGRESA